MKVRKKSIATALGFVAISAIVVTGCGAGSGAASRTGAASGGLTNTGTFDSSAVLRWGVPAMPSSFDLRKSRQLDATYLDAVYESLIKRTPSGDLGPGLATKWSFSPDRKLLTLTLREGVKFQDGETFDADAVVASMKAFAKEGSQSSALADITNVAALSKYKVRITFKRPAGYMLNVLAGQAGMIVAPDSLDDPDLGTKPVGTGPFELTSYAKGKLVFKKFDGYWNKSKVTIGGIEMDVYSDESTRLRAIASGQLDGATIKGGQVKEAKSRGLQVVKSASTTFKGFILNTSASKFSNSLVRKAIVYAIDRKAISDSLYSGECKPRVQPNSKESRPNVTSLNDTSKYYDPDKAKQLLAEAGLPNGFEFQLDVGENTSYRNLAEAIQAQLAKVDIRAKIKTMQFVQANNALQTGNYAALVTLFQAGQPDVGQFLTDYYSPQGAFNAGKFSIPGISKMIEKSQAESEISKRAPITRQIISDVFDAGPPVIPVCTSTWIGAFRKGVTNLGTTIWGDYDYSTVKISH